MARPSPSRGAITCFRSGTARSRRGCWSFCATTRSDSLERLSPEQEGASGRAAGALARVDRAARRGGCRDDQKQRQHIENDLDALRLGDVADDDMEELAENAVLRQEPRRIPDTVAQWRQQSRLCQEGRRLRGETSREERDDDPRNLEDVAHGDAREAGIDQPAD